MSLIAALLLGAASPLPIETFDNIAPWTADASDSVTASLASSPGARGRALRLNYDFGRVSGYAFAHRPLPVAFPGNYELSFRIRGQGGTNELQIKFVDGSGDNVWWIKREDFRPTAEWQTIRVRRRDVEFAWGPTQDKTLRNTARLEIVLARSREGGKGYVEIDDLELHPLPAQPAQLPPPRPSDRRATDADPATFASLSPGTPLTIDFGGAQQLGGVLLRWRGIPPTYRLEGHEGDARWRTLRTVRKSDGGDDPIALPDAELHALRIVPEGPAELSELVVKPVEWGANSNAFVTELARAAPRGEYPRNFLEQTYWTLVGTDGGEESALIGEDGAIEVAKGGFSIEPFILADGKRFSWADVTVSQSLEDGYLPIPHVQWDSQGWRLDTSLFADPSVPGGRLMARYRLTNTGAAPRKLRLALAIRPFQVNAPAQFLSQRGGVSKISAIRASRTAIEVESPPAIEGQKVVTRRVLPLVAPSAVALASFDSGGVLGRLSGSSSDRSIADETGLASGALLYDLELAPGETSEIPLVIPFDASTTAPGRAAFDRAHADTVAHWRDKLDQVRVKVPPARQHLADSIRTGLAHMLMSRAGPMLKPGTRSYNRSWIRDGAMISDGLLRLGVVEPVREYADWYSGHLFANGKVPCCVDFRGADPVPENDSHGEYIYLLAQLYRFTGDRSVLERRWPELLGALTYMESLRQSERTPANLTPERRMLYGLMPPSISHEGYSAKPQYSLWDDFWALRGYKDGADIAALLGKPEAAAIARQRDEFRTDLHAAIAAAARHWKTDYIPGATSLGDHDATSTTMAFDPAGEQLSLDQRLLNGTFERYWRNVVERRENRTEWKDYTPYELRNVSAFVRLGWRQRSDELLTYFFNDQRPRAWNGWAEVVGRDPREIRFIGDMPHAWVASDFVRAALDLFAYERRDDEAIVLAAGLTPDYLDGKGSGIEGLRTASGTLNLDIRSDHRKLVVNISGNARSKGGFVLPWPLEGQPGAATINGRPVRFQDGALVFPATGAPIVIEVERH